MQIGVSPGVRTKYETSLKITYVSNLFVESLWIVSISAISSCIFYICICTCPFVRGNVIVSLSYLQTNHFWLSLSRISDRRREASNTFLSRFAMEIPETARLMKHNTAVTCSLAMRNKMRCLCARSLTYQLLDCKNFVWLMVEHKKIYISPAHASLRHSAQLAKTEMNEKLFD